MGRVFILGGYQTDFAQNWSKQGAGLFEVVKATVDGALQAAKIEPADVGVFHIGNFTGELFSKQGHLGGFTASLRPEFSGVPAMRHEAACASGSAAVLAAAADIEAGRYSVACVLGVEQMRNVSGDVAADYLGAAAWRGREGEGAKYLWPHMFGLLADEYEKRYGLSQKHLSRIAEVNFANAKKNPAAQTRGWKFTDKSFVADDEANPVVEGRIRRQDCSQLTDGGAAIFLASEEFAAKLGRKPPFIRGWGHRTAPMLFEDKVRASASSPHVFPHVAGTVKDAFRRAGISSALQLGGIETHDCFTITEYMAIDHFGLTPPGESWRAIEERVIELGGRVPINPSGGLIGGGHPIGATGVRQVLDAAKQVTGTAGDYQVEGAKTFATLNIGGSATTSISFIVGM